jgi:hypothetical protein
MNKYHKLFSLFLFLMLSSTQLLAQKKDLKPPYQYQLCLELGVGDISAPGTEFPFGESYSASFRYNNHLFGFRKSRFSDLNFSGPSTYFSFAGPIYGFAFQRKYTSLLPQVGVGLLSSNHNSAFELTKPGMEVSLSMNLHVRGIGFGFRPFFNLNPTESYVGYAVHLFVGWEWNSKENIRD